MKRGVVCFAIFLILCSSSAFAATPYSSAAGYHPLQQVTTDQTGTTSVDANSNGIIDTADSTSTFTGDSIGSGTTDVTFKIKGGTNLWSAIDFYNGAGAYWGMGKSRAFGDYRDNDFYIDRTGVRRALTIDATTLNVGIDMDNPQYKLDVNGDVRVQGAILPRSTGVGGVKTVRNVWGNGLYNYQVYSDSNAPTTYGAVVGFGSGTSGTGEVYQEWTSPWRLFHRALRDCCESWSSWIRVLDSSNDPYAANMNQYVRTTDSPTFNVVTASSFTGAGTGLTGTAASLTSGKATALAANPTDCAAGQAPTSIDASGNFAGCTAYLTSESDTLASVTSRGFNTRSSSGAFAVNNQATPGLEIYGAGGAEPSFMTFHRPGVYAVKFGLDGSDLKVGGWSMGNVAYKIWHEGNDGSGTGLAADYWDGYDTPSGWDLDASNDITTSNIGSQSVAYASNSGLWSGYSQDGTFRAHMGLSKTYTDRTTITSDQRYWTGSTGWGNTDFNALYSSWGSGFFDTWGWPGNRPNDASSHWVGFQGMHFSHGDGTNAYGFQMAMAGEANNRFFWRSGWPTPRPWVEMIHSGNIGSQSVNYATSTGTANYWDGYDTPSGWDLDASNDITTSNIGSQSVAYASNSALWSGYSQDGTFRAHMGLSKSYTDRTAITSDQNYWTGTQGWGNTYTWDTAWSGGAGFYDNWGTNMGHPLGSGYTHAQGIVSGLHYNGGGTGYGWMIVGAPDATANRYWLRGKWGSSVSGWVEMITTGNIGSQSVSTANYWDGYDTPSGWDLDASNDITTSNIGSQTVNYATSSGSATLLNPMSGTSTKKLAYVADGVYDFAGANGRVVMYDTATAKKYGVMVDNADNAGYASNANLLDNLDSSYFKYYQRDGSNIYDWYMSYNTPWNGWAKWIRSDGANAVAVGYADSAGSASSWAGYSTPTGWDLNAADDVTTSGTQTIAGTKTFSNKITGSVTGNSTYATYLYPVRGDMNYRLAYSADGVRTYPGAVYGRAVMYYAPSGQTYDLMVYRADVAGSSGTATSLAANPTDCTAGKAPTTIDASGNFGGCTTYLTAEADGSTTNEIQNLFQTISTTSGTAPVADSSADTLTLTAGSGITITGDATTDKVTITAPAQTAVPYLNSQGAVQGGLDGSSIYGGYFFGTGTSALYAQGGLRGGTFGGSSYGIHATGSPGYSFGVYANGGYGGVETFGVNYGVTAYGATGVYAQGTTYDFYAGGSGIDYGTSSSIRWKNNITRLTGSLNTIMKLNGVSFDWDKEHGGGHTIGFIGEEVGKYYPEIVSFDSSSTDPSYYVTGMDYSKMAPILLEGVKELKTEKDEQVAELQNTILAQQKAIDEQQETINDQQKSINELQRKVEELLQK